MQDCRICDQPSTRGRLGDDDDVDDDDGDDDDYDGECMSNT